MIVSVILLLFFACIAWLGLRFGLNAAENNLGRARIVVLTAVCCFVLAVLTVSFVATSSTQRQMAGLVRKQGCR